MGINIRQKGQEGEREIAKMLNLIVKQVRGELGLPLYETKDEIFQRNQNQSAVGGSDLSNPLSLEIEVKRQEALSVGSWWKQCVTSAERTDGIPILIFRQNRKPWRVCLFVEIPLQTSFNQVSDYSFMSRVKAEIDIDTFKHWFRVYYKKWLARNG